MALQYLKDGLSWQLFVMVCLKSGGGFKLLRSSTTDPANVEESKVDETISMMKNGVELMKAIARFCGRKWTCSFC